MTKPLRLGARGSALALAQSQIVADGLGRAAGVDVELVVIRTVGDVTPGPLSEMKQPGVFVAALREALMADEVDFVVHSMKDLPSAQPFGVTIAAVPGRADAHDALVTYQRVRLDDLPAGARIGTSSPRRAARLRVRRPDLAIVDIRGNVDSRIDKVRRGEYDAAVLAVAGLVRLGRSNEIDETIDMDTMLPAPAQGALAVECRLMDVELARTLAVLEDRDARLRTTAERAVLAAVEATCASAVGAYAAIESGLLTLTADVSGRSPAEYVSRTSQVRLTGKASRDRDHAGELGMAVGAALLAAGAGTYVRPERDDA